VEFFADGTLVGTQVLAPYQVTWSNVPPGRHVLTARATDLVGLVTTSLPITISVGSAPTVVITSPSNGATFAATATITVTANASDSDGTITGVQFFDGNSLVGTAIPTPGNSSYGVTVSGLASGTHSLTARAADDSGFSTTSSAVVVSVAAASARTYYIHTDHLNTPRMIANQTGAMVWRNDNTEPFGASMPNDNLDGDDQPFVFDLRFPGQFFDRETNLNYNYFRDYDSSLGRYVESDPIGVKGGINTYAYVSDSPIWQDGSTRIELAK